MKKSVYSFGENSPLKFKIPDKLATRYNEAVEEWFKAQRRFNQKFGRRWDPKTDPIEMRWTSKQKKAWNEFARIYKYVLDAEGPFHENDLMDDFLVKNTAAGIANRATTGVGDQIGGMVLMGSVSSSSWRRVITLAAAGGALYGFFNRR